MYNRGRNIYDSYYNILFNDDCYNCDIYNYEHNYNRKKKETQEEMMIKYIKGWKKMAERYQASEKKDTTGTGEFTKAAR